MNEKLVEKRPKTLLGFRLSAIIELALLLGVLLLASTFWGSGNRFWDTNPHPFWLPVLLLACKYGTREGLLAALAASFALLAFNLPEQPMGQDGYAYLLTVLKTPLLWLVAGVGFGELRQMHIRERNGLREDLADSREREEAIGRSYEWVKQLKERLELRVAGQLRSSISTYQAARALETFTPGEVLKGLEQMLVSAMRPEKFSIYSLDSQFISGMALDLALTHGWGERDGYVRRFEADSPLAQAILGGQMLSVVNAEQERLLAGQAILAGPMVDRDSGEVVGMIKIESLGFADLNITSIESFQAICEWAGLAVVNARKYQQAKDGSVINPDHNLLSYSYYQRFVEYITQLARRLNFDVTMLVVRMSNAEQLTPEERARIGRLLSDSVDRVLRKVDLAFDYRRTSEEFTIVMPATPRAGAQVVLEKIRADLLAGAGATTRQAQFSFAVQAIYEK